MCTCFELFKRICFKSQWSDVIMLESHMVCWMQTPSATDNIRLLCLLTLGEIGKHMYVFHSAWLVFALHLFVALKWADSFVCFLSSIMCTVLRNWLKKQFPKTQRNTRCNRTCYFTQNQRVQAIAAVKESLFHFHFLLSAFILVNPFILVTVTVQIPE